MINNELRIGNFTSSCIGDLLTVAKNKTDFGAPAIKYIAEKNMERIIGRALKTETDSRPTSWGKLLEPRVFDLLGLDYQYMATETIIHPTIDCWAGSPDGVRYGIESKPVSVMDIKCPMTIKSFCSLVLPLYFGKTGMDAINDVRNGFEHEGIKYPAHAEGDTYYWQLVSNAILTGLDHAELIIYMPYQSELLDIKKLADGNPSVYWMNFIEDNAIPYLPDGGALNNLYILQFEVPLDDKRMLTDAVKKASGMLINRL